MELALHGVGVDVDGRALLAELDLRVGRGEIVGLVGPNGSGKSTALRCVYRALRPSTGTVRLDGADVRAVSLRETARVVAAMTQDGGAGLDFTVAEVVELGRAPHRRGNAALSGRERELCRWAMERTDVTHLAGRSVLTLSGGERQRVLLARTLVQEPRVLVLDEPTNHLDVRHQVELLSFLRGCGLTVLVVLHDLNLAASCCDRLAVLAEGRLAALGEPADVLTAELARDVFGVDVAVVTHPDTGCPQLLYRIDPRSGGPS